MNRFVVGIVIGTLVLTLAACGRKVDEELLPTRVPTLAPDAFAVTPLPAPTATPAPVAAAETNAAAALTTTQAGTTAEPVTAPITEASTTTETAEATEPAETAPTDSSGLAAGASVTATEPTADEALTSGQLVTETATMTETAAMTESEEINAAETPATASLLPTPTPEPTAAPEATAEPTATVEPTAEPTVEPTATAEPTAEPTVEATTAPVAPAGNEAVTELPAAVEAALANANVTRGQSLTLSNACIGCHSNDAKQMMVGPTWHNIGETAATRVEGESAEVYLYNSIVHPNAYLVPGYLAGIMIQTYGQTLSDQDIADLIAYLLSLKGQS